MSRGSRFDDGDAALPRRASAAGIAGRLALSGGLALAVLAFTVTVAPVAHADNCGSFTDCFSTIDVALLVLLGVLLLAVVAWFLLPELLAFEGMGAAIDTAFMEGAAEFEAEAAAEVFEGFEATEAAEGAEAAESAVGPGRLTQSEFDQLQQVAQRYDTEFDVVGSRAEGAGRNIDTDLPVGKDPPEAPNTTRSDIDVRINGQTDINSGGRFSDDLRNIDDGSVNIHDPGLPERPSSPPYIRITPKGGFWFKP